MLTIPTKIMQNVAQGCQKTYTQPRQMQEKHASQQAHALCNVTGCRFI